MATLPSARRFTVREYYKMAKAGIFNEDDRVELIEGEIVQLPSVGGPHAACVDRLTRLMVTGLGEAAIVRVQSPFRLSDITEPLPDLTLLKPKADFYASGHPGPPETLLAIEVSDTTLAYDRGRKLPLYARSGVPETWIVDLPHSRIELHWDPTPDGYRNVRICARGDRIAPRAFPDLDLAVDAILGAP